MLHFRWRHLSCYFSILFLVIATAGSGLFFSPDADAKPVSSAEEYEIKAAFLYNLASFITWPTELPEAAPDDFLICILGEDHFKENIDLLVDGETIEKLPVKITRLKKIEEAAICRILFVSDSEVDNYERLFVWLEKRPILTVGDGGDFVESGGMIEFYERSNRVRLALDPETIREAGMQASAHLLRIAQHVRGGKKSNE